MQPKLCNNFVHSFDVFARKSPGFLSRLESGNPLYELLSGWEMSANGVQGKPRRITIQYNTINVLVPSLQNMADCALQFSE